jgi:hypothetical protein
MMESQHRVLVSNLTLVTVHRNKAVRRSRGAMSCDVSVSPTAVAPPPSHSDGTGNMKSVPAKFESTRVTSLICMDLKAQS